MVENMSLIPFCARMRKSLIIAINEITVALTDSHYLMIAVLNIEFERLSGLDHFMKSGPLDIIMYINLATGMVYM